MKTNERRITKLCENMSAKDSTRAILDAVRADDCGLRDKLLEAVPRVKCTSRDPRVTFTVAASESLSLRFDRTFFHLLATRFACQLPHILKEEPPKDILTAIDNMDTELLALTTGAEIFAERIGLNLEQVLAFSTVLDAEHHKDIKQPRDTLSEHDLEKAKEVADAFQKAWSLEGNVIDNFGEAA